MRYVSTRGTAAPVSFADAALGGVAPDGGLWMPERWPVLWRGDAPPPGSYAALAAQILDAFADGEIPRAGLNEMASRAYAPFANPACAPLRQIGDSEWLLELFHGPTLAFKDFALRLIAEVWDHLLAERGSRLTAVVATSGDTGGAAVDALKGRAAVDLFALHPRGRISEVQRRFMTSVDAENIANVEIDGDFDSCQAMVKSLFADSDFVSHARLAAVNSINWARIAAQAAYYVAACRALGWPAKGVVAVAPTGNFGDAFAGYVAQRLGAPIRKIVTATNANDIVFRALSQGRFDRRESYATLSPAMDIQAPNNFERLLFEALDRDAAAVARLYAQFSQSDGFAVPDGARAAIAKIFAADRADDAQTLTAMRSAYDSFGEMICPHTATALHAAARLKGEEGPVLVLATAHPAKFPETVQTATGASPPLPPRCADLFDKPEHIAAHFAAAQGIEPLKNLIRERSRAWR